MKMLVDQQIGLNFIVENKINPPYGLGIKRSLQDYAKFSGLDIAAKQVLDPDNVFRFTKLNNIKWTDNSEKFKFF